MRARSLAALLLSAIAVTTATGDDRTPQLRVTTKRPDDKAEIKFEDSRALVSVRSPFGISQAVIERAGDRWPEAVVLRLHLTGLERFRASNGKAMLEAAASVQAGKPLVRVWKDGKEDAPLDANSPYWMEVRILGGDGKPAKEIPLEGGYFEVRLPKAFFESNPKSVTVSWVDFYRG